MTSLSLDDIDEEFRQSKLDEARRRLATGDLKGSAAWARAAGGAEGDRVGAEILARALLKLDDPAEARRVLDRAIELHADVYALLILRAAAAERLNDVDAAARDAAACVELDRDKEDGYSVLASVFRRAGRLDEAALFQWEVLLRRSNDEDAYQNMAMILRERGKFAEACEVLQVGHTTLPDSLGIVLLLMDSLMQVREFDRSIEIGKAACQRFPDDFRVMRNLGNAYRWGGYRAEAIATFERLLELVPGDGYATHLLNSLHGEASERADDGYVQELFDGYAETFDDKLVNTLHYRVPGLIHNAVLRQQPTRRDLRILDLGCGTGLCGIVLKDRCAYLKGVDLSPKMVEQAAARGLYDDLVVGEVNGVLRMENQRYDLVVAGDVFVYLGELETVLTAMRAVIAPGGHAVFSVELSPEPSGFVLQGNARYAHSLGYVSGTAEAAGYEIVELDPQALRLDAGRPVSGLICVLQNPQ